MLVVHGTSQIGASVMAKINSIEMPESVAYSKLFLCDCSI